MSQENQMTKPEHTPGPWALKTFESGAFFITEGDDTDDIDNMILASVGVDRAVLWAGREKERIANAKLMVNAPKMFKALQDIVAHQEMVGGSVPSATKLIAMNAISAVAGSSQ